MEKFTVKKSQITGKGLFSLHTYKFGDFIDYIKGPKICIRKFTPTLSQQGLNWIGASKYTWINTDNSPFRYINHSCDPNVAIKGERTVYAIKTIRPGDELTMDYSITETENGWGFTCNCGSKNCRKKIGPITDLTRAEFNKLKPYITKKFTAVYEAQQKISTHTKTIR